MHRRYAMTKEIHKNEVVLAMEFTNHSTKRIYLTRCARNEIFLPFPINLLKCFFGIALYVLTADRLDEFFNSSSNVVFRSLLFYIISASYSVITFGDKLFSYFKANTTTRTLSTYCFIIAPCSP